MRARFCVALGLLLCAAAGAASENGFTRIDLERTDSQLTVEGSIGHFAYHAHGGEIHVFGTHLSLEYAIRSHGFNARLPFTMAMYTGPEELNSFAHGFGDAQLTYTYSMQRGRVNFTFGGFWGMPLPARGVENQGLAVNPGSGRHNIGVLFALAGIRDPVVWNMGFSYGVGLPRRENGVWSLQPGNIRINAGVTALLNEVFGFRANLYQELRLPQVNSNGANAAGFATSTFFVPEALVLGDNWLLRVGLHVYAHPIAAPAIVRITYSHIFYFPAR